jgi:hypothetical protein
MSLFYRFYGGIPEQPCVSPYAEAHSLLVSILFLMMRILHECAVFASSLLAVFVYGFDSVFAACDMVPLTIFIV